MTCVPRVLAHHGPVIALVRVDPTAVAVANCAGMVPAPRRETPTSSLLAVLVLRRQEAVRARLLPLRDDPVHRPMVARVHRRARRRTIPNGAVGVPSVNKSKCHHRRKMNITMILWPLLSSNTGDKSNH